ncbi:MAG: pyruvate kinase [candidate division SR1 bacterium]|nr:pyruvate kinase [candidate division SR1 bacterium]
MNNFHFSKIIAGVGPTLAKETVLSKVINMVDVFRISLSGGFDDNNKKYIDTIMKLDNSKTIMMETRGSDIRVKNVMDIKVKARQTIEIEYSEYAQEHDKRIFVDAAFLRQLKVGQVIKFQQSGVVIKIKSNKEDATMCEVIEGGWIIQFDRVFFNNYDLDLPFLGERDKHDILRGLEYGIHVMAPSLVKTRDDIIELKDFLKTKNAGNMKILAKIETEEALENVDDILDISDGLIFVFEKIEKAMKNLKLNEEILVKKCKTLGKPAIVTFVGKIEKNKYQLINDTQLKKFSNMAADGYMLDTLLQEDDPLDMITKLSDTLDTLELKIAPQELTKFYANNEYMVRDYIIYNAHRATQEVDVRALVLYTENGYSAGRLSSLKPRVPIIAFTKSDENYRYLNMLRGVRGYKISQSFSYENLKRIGKEMIRIIFKGNISLDDKIIIVQANEEIKDEKSGMINGLELYKFKNI